MTRGGIFAYPTKALPELFNNNGTDSKIILNELEGSVFAVALGIAGLVCSSLGGILAGWIGRRKTILLTSPFVAIGWLGIILDGKIDMYNWIQGGLYWRIGRVNPPPF